MTMNDRLQQAEAQLAASAKAGSIQSITAPWGTDIGQPALTDRSFHSAGSSTGLYDLSMIPASISPTQAVNQLSEHTYVNCLDYQFENFASDMSVDEVDYIIPNPLLDGIQPIPSGPMFKTTIPSPDHTIPELSTGLLQRLRDIGFDIYWPIMAMVDHARFEAEIAQPSPSIQARALSYAIGALGAFSVPELRCHVEQCYQQSRNLIELCERQDSGEALTSINTVQACTLLTLYELKQPNFARAWMSLGRSIQLGKMMGLDQADGHSGMATQWPTQLIAPLSPAEVEERRRTFWILYILDAFVSTSTKLSMNFNGEGLVALPGPELAIRDFTQTGVTMQSLSQIFDSNMLVKTPVSSFAGIVIMVYLYRRCSEHIKSSSHQQSHNFWDTHYGIDKAIGLCRSFVLVEHLNGNSCDDPVSLALRISMDAVEIMLHECAWLKVQKDKLPSVLTTDAIWRCTSAATDIADSIQMGERLTGRKLESFQQLSNFHTWPITTATQLCCRMLLRGGDDRSPYIHTIRVLSGSTITKLLIEQRLFDPGVLEEASAHVAAAEKSTSST